MNERVELPEETEDQDVVDEIGRTAGVTYADNEELRPGLKEAERDKHRWELDPASAEDYPERTHPHAEGPSNPVLHMTHRGHQPHGG